MQIREEVGVVFGIPQQDVMLIESIIALKNYY